jgi:uncharacterized membrane protein
MVGKHGALLVVWMAIAAILRFTHLTLKPLWADEFSTLVFSLGNSFLTVPLDRAISLTELLQPLQPNPQAEIGSVLQHLFNESNHPPLYFILTHLWLRLFPTENGWVSLWAARALSSLLGVLSVPVCFGVGWFAFRSRWVGHLAALLMALSPFGVYLAQEARHYTFAILWILLSLACLVSATQHLRDRHPLPWELCITWIVVNTLGIATHYFFIFTLIAEAIALGGWLFQNAEGRKQKAKDRRQKDKEQGAGSREQGKKSQKVKISRPESQVSCQPSAISQQQSADKIQNPKSKIQNPKLPIPHPPSRLFLITLGTLAGGIVWLPVLLNIRGTELTRWLQKGEFDKSGFFDPILRTLAGIASMVFALPVQGVPLSVVIVAGIAIGLMLLLTMKLVIRGLQQQFAAPESQTAVQILAAFVVAAIALSFLVTYGLGMNIASVFRYQFFYFPAVILLLAAGLARTTHTKIQNPKSKIPHSSLLVGILLFSLLGSLTVISNLAYQKTHRPDAIAQAIDASFQHPALIAIPHKTHGHMGRLMGIAWELQRLSPMKANQTQFLLAHHDAEDPQPAIASLQRTLEQFPRPLEVWRVNFRSKANPLSQAVLTQQNCVAQSKLHSVDGYRYQPFTCP